MACRTHQLTDGRMRGYTHFLSGILATKNAPPSSENINCMTFLVLLSQGLQPMTIIAKHKLHDIHREPFTVYRRTIRQSSSQNITVNDFDRLLSPDLDRGVVTGDGLDEAVSLFAEEVGYRSFDFRRVGGALAGRGRPITTRRQQMRQLLAYRRGGGE